MADPGPFLCCLGPGINGLGCDDEDGNGDNGEDEEKMRALAWAGSTWLWANLCHRNETTPTMRISNDGSWHLHISLKLRDTSI